MPARTRARSRRRSPPTPPQQCLYGVDKNKAAVELAKLSLWLLGEAPEQAVGLRQQILEPADKQDVASQAEKRRLFDVSQQAIERVPGDLF